jgi:hypothetical protein
MSENHNHSKKAGPRDGVYSKRIPAGRRTYFFDVRATKTNDYYITITESKRLPGDDGSPVYEKHKIFIYRDDFDRFFDGLKDSLEKANEYKANSPSQPQAESYSHPDEVEKDSSGTTSFTDVNFEDLK